jgi:hypothetical protein
VPAGEQNGDTAGFEAWIRAEAIPAVHHRAAAHRPANPEHPQFEGFEARQTMGFAHAGGVTVYIPQLSIHERRLDQ